MKYGRRKSPVVSVTHSMSYGAKRGGLECPTCHRSISPGSKLSMDLTVFVFGLIVGAVVTITSLVVYTAVLA